MTRDQASAFAPPPSPPPGVAVDDPEEDDIEAAHRLSKTGTAMAAGAMTDRARAVVLVVVALFALCILTNLTATIVLYNKAVDTSVEQATQMRLNGIAQDQAREATQLAKPSNEKLVSEGFAPLPIPGVYEAPATDVVTAAAAAQVLGLLDPNDITNLNTAAIGPATDRAFDMRLFDVSQSGPTRIRVASVAYQYMQLQAAGAVPRMTIGLQTPPPPPPR